MTAPKDSDRSPEQDVGRDHAMEHRRALAVGIAASAALHIAVILLYSVFITEWRPGETLVAVDSPSRGFDDMRVVRVVEIEPPDLTAEPPDEPSQPTAEIELEVADIGPAHSGGCRSR